MSLKPVSVGSICALILVHSLANAQQPPSGPKSGATATSQIAPPGTSRTLRECRSANLVMWTDLPAADADQAMQRLERTLATAEKYWGREQRGKIDCYLIQDVGSLPEKEVPHRLARILIGEIGGATFTKVMVSGRDGRSQSTVFASTRPGVVEHEVVHAYCCQTHGSTGPDWYKEGMAEMVVLRCSRESGVVCSEEQLQELRQEPLPTVQQVMAAGAAGNRLMESLQGMLSDPKNHGRNIPLSDWKQHHAIHVTHARREYLRSWAFCYLLLHNPNYAPRFRTLGQRYMSGQPNDFPLLFAAMDREIAFEYAFFLRNIAAGYRVDLCRWDWNKRFRELKPSESMVARVAAARGFQASGLNVVQGESYSYESQGTWSLSQTETPKTADGRHSAGALVGVVLHDFDLSEPFELGARGTFVAPRSGQLYLRCNESFNQIQDNRGAIEVKLAEL